MREGECERRGLNVGECGAMWGNECFWLGGKGLTCEVLAA